MNNPSAKPAANLSVILLAAGRASRFGSAKQLALFRNNTLLKHALNLAGSISNDVIVVTGAYASQIKKHCQSYSVKTVHNSDWANGMGSSVRTGIQQVAPETYAAMVLLVDQPLVTESHLQALIHTWRQTGSWAVSSRYHNGYGVPALFDQSAFEKLAMLKGDMGARQLLNAGDCKPLGIEPDFPLIDIDTQEQLQLAQKNYPAPALK